MVLSFNPHVVRGMEVEKEKLLSEGGGGGEDCEGLGGGAGGSGQVEDYGEGGVEEEGEGDGSVFEVVEMVGGDGEIVVEGLMAFRADEEFHGDGDAGADSNQEELEVAELGEGEPGEGAVGFGMEGEEFDVVEEMP
ncbi:hypothetical protein IEQ34_019477 [Dendrobium chrysotoxum]|uniref:Uncharacterized protein n=1 Tax=Dendrobium chrysotoxum TaxID=161865 RepID=A0AAV7GA23_DENCH|nr:hypothetical protein IEQ34_019477 [Dendrobium chrysotoxum]